MGQVSGQFNLDVNESNVGNNKIKDGSFVERIGNDDGKIVLKKVVPAGAAGADTDGTADAFYVVPAGKEFLLTSASVVVQGVPAGIDNSNPLSIAVQTMDSPARILAANTFSDNNPYTTQGGAKALVLGDFKKVAAGGVITHVVVQGATADHNGFALIVEGTLKDA